MRVYLKRAGYQVSLARDGEVALESLALHLPDLVVLDLMLPKFDGLEITRWLRAQGDTPIIMLTARREERDRIAGLEMGADDYVVKPFSPQELVSRVRAVLRRVRGSPLPGVEGPLEFSDLKIDPRHPAGSSRRQRELSAPRNSICSGCWPPSPPGVYPRTVARPRLGPGGLHRSEHGNGTRAPPARENRERPREPTRIS